jgi:hypothetical protein
MSRSASLAVSLAAVGCHLVAVLSFVVWLGQTDWLFGHFSGPRSLVTGALVWAALGIGGSVVWFIWSCRRNPVLAAALVVLSVLSGMVVLGALGVLNPEWGSRHAPTGGGLKPSTNRR